MVAHTNSDASRSSALMPARVRSVSLWIRALFNTSADCPTKAFSTSTRSSTTVEDPSTSTTPKASPSCVIGKIPSETPTVPWIGRLTGCCVRKAVRRLLDRRRPEPSSGPSLTITRSRPAASGTATRTVAEAPPAAARIQRAHDVAASTTSNRCGARLDVRKRTCLRAHRADQTWRLFFPGGTRHRVWNTLCVPVNGLRGTPYRSTRECPPIVV